MILIACLSLIPFAVFAGGGKQDSGSKGKEVDMSVTQKVPTGRFIVTPQLIGYENAEIELTWQPSPSHSMSAPSKARVDDLTKKAEAWVKKYPNVKIVPVGTTNNINDNMTKLRVTVVEGGAPDLCAVDSFMMPLFAEYARPIQDIATARGIDVKDFFPFIQDTVLRGDDLLALWYTTDVRGLFYRKDLISKAPSTVDELIATGRDMTSKGMTGLIYLGGRNEGTVNNLWGLYWSQGAKLIDSKGNLGFESGSGKTAMLEFLNFFKRTIDSGVTPRTVIDYKSDANMYGDIANGKIAMFIASSSAIVQLREIMGAEQFNKLWGLAPLPTMKAGQKSTSSAGGWTNVVFARDELHRRLAADLAIDLYSSDEAAESWSFAGGYLPTRKSQYEKFAFIRNDPYLSFCQKLLNDASTRPPVELYNVISLETQVAVGNVITGTNTPEQALEATIKNIKNN